MKTATFEHSVNVLLKAYLNDTLEHGKCSACAVGNMLGTERWSHYFVTASNEEGEFTQHKHKEGFVYGINWFGLITCIPFDDLPLDVKPKAIEGKEAIKNSGYSIENLQEIEFAFETAPMDNSEDDYMFNGLMAVIDVLAQIHKVDLTTVKEAKELFV